MNNPTPRLRPINRKVKLVLYFFLGIAAFVIDYYSKTWALNNLKTEDIFIFPGLNLSLVFNRGISWGLFNFQSMFAFYGLTSIIMLATALFLVYTIYLLKQNQDIFFEILVLVGACSNILDRFLYGSVVDFIDLYVGSWHWPTFNFADAFIVIGVFGMLGRHLYDVYLGENKRNLF